jgi:S1-C subfamily serine protease
MKQLMIVVVLVAMFAVLGFKAGDVDAFPRIVDRSMQSVVTLHIAGYDRHVGTGFYVGDGKIVTAGHMVEDGKLIRAEFEDGTVCEIIGEFDCSDYDVAVLFIEPVDKPALKFDDDGVVRGEDVFICGNPRNQTFMVFEGIVAGTTIAYPKDFGNIELIVTTCVGTNGNSGSPLLDAEGEVVGVWNGTCQPPPYHIKLAGLRSNGVRRWQLVEQ